MEEKFVLGVQEFLNGVNGVPFKRGARKMFGSKGQVFLVVLFDAEVSKSKKVLWIIGDMISQLAVRSES